MEGEPKEGTSKILCVIEVSHHHSASYFSDYTLFPTKKAIFQALKIWKGFVVSPIYNQTNIFRKVKSVHKQNEAQEMVRSVFMPF